MFPFFAAMRVPTIAAVVALLGGLAVLGACTPLRDNNGNIPLAEVVDSIELGKTTRDQVASKLGSPSTKATFEQDHVWYYIGKRTESLAFFRPDVLQHQVLIIQFDGKGIVTSVKRHDAKTAEEIELVARTTPTKGNELTFFEQLIGNLGRFNPASVGRDSGDSLGGP